MINSLIRPSKDVAISFCPETVIIIGAGATTNKSGNAWTPAQRAIAQNTFFQMSPMAKEKYLSLEPDILLSHIAYFSRISFNNFFKDKESTDNTGFRKLLDGYTKDLSRIEQLRTAVANEYEDATQNKEIGLSDWPPSVRDRIYLPSTGVITTNWDENLWLDLGIKNLIQLHGRAGVPRSLILPTESMIDHDSIRYSHRSPNPSLKDELLIAAYDQASRGEAVAQELLFAHIYARIWIQSAKNLIIYGIAGHIYDVELQSLFIGDDEQIKESVEIINTCENHFNRWRGITRT